jgi:hypothetical protein
MSAVKYELNIRKIIPAHILDKLRVFTSGGSLFAYEKSTENRISTEISASKNWMSEVKTILGNFRFEKTGKPVFEKIYTQMNDELKTAGLLHPDGPKLIAFANENFSLQDSMSNELVLSDASDPKGPKPRPRGQHGHNSLNDRMRTIVGFWGPSLSTLDASKIKMNTDLVPEIAKALNLPTPIQCRGGTGR